MWCFRKVNILFKICKYYLQLLCLHLHKSECLCVLNSVWRLMLFVCLSGWSDVLKFHFFLEHVSLNYNYTFTVVYFIVCHMFRP
jgi:hypothetical protein